MTWYHFADHHDVGSQVLVDSKDVEDSDVPEDDVDAVDDASVAHGGFVLQAQQQTQQEDGDGHQVCDVPVILQPHVDLLLQLPRLRHQDLMSTVYFNFFLFSLCSEQKTFDLISH